MAEDMIAANFIDKEIGFYVDIGAYHPKRFSNTFYFYKKGWRGINVDGAAEAIRLLKKHRKKDISIQALMGKDAEPVTFYEFAQRELNTTVKESLPDIKKYHDQTPVNRRTVNCLSLETLLDQYLPENTTIDLLNIDAEGADETILRSNNWEKYKPKLIIVEKHASVEDCMNSTLYSLLSENNYTLKGFCKHAFIFLHHTQS